MRVGTWLALIIGAALAACSPAQSVPAVGSPLPRLSVIHLDGGTGTLQEFAGRALVLNFWATWCPPCRAEMPSLQRLADAFPEAELAVVGVSVDADQNLVREFVLQHGIRFPVVVQSPATPAVGQLGVTAFPTTILVTREGRIAAIVTGERDWSDAVSLARIENALHLTRRNGGSRDAGSLGDKEGRRPTTGAGYPGL